LKRLISIALVFHLLVIFIFPVSSSLLWSQFAPFMIPYANALGLNSTWQFFAPEPETWVYLEYEIDYSETPSEDVRPKIYKWPEPRKLLFDPLFTHQSSVKGFAFHFPKDIPLTLGRWFCLQHEDAFSISFRRVSLAIPTFEDVRSGKTIVEENSVAAELGSVVCSDVKALL
jgi:hypothetical protein